MQPMEFAAVTLLIDTCVWLDLAKDHRQRPILAALERLLDSGEVGLAVPRLVRQEFNANKARVAADSTRSLSSVLRRAKGAVDQFGGFGSKGAALAELNDIDYRLTTFGESVNDAIAQIEQLFEMGSIVETTESAVNRAGHRALTRRAPCHKPKNSMADAVLIELYGALVDGGEDTHAFAFVTHNKHDFSDMGKDERQPHPDIASLFDGCTIDLLTRTR
jgi:hypothetical protein